MTPTPEQAKPGQGKTCHECLHPLVCMDTGRCTRTLPPLNPDGPLAKALRQVFGRDTSNETTPTPPESMNIEEKRIKIAEACGWKLMAPVDHPALFSLPNNWMPPTHINDRLAVATRGQHPGLPPDYFNDLNAMHEAVSLYQREKGNQFFFFEYQQKLFATACPGFSEDSLYRYSLCQFEVTEATAAQRFEAFGLTLGLWKEGE